jgi:SAM-dependent methyltransferase
MPEKPRLAEIFLVVDRRVKQLLRGIAAIPQGLWLGLLDRASLHCVTEATYCSMASYQRQSYNLSGLTNWESAVVERFFGDCRCILVGGAGGGREIIALSQRNFQVAAFDPSPVLVQSCIELLAEQRIQAEVIVSAPDEVPESLGIYDGLIVGWGAYLHIQGRHARVEFLKQFRRHVHLGGPILLSFWARESEARGFRWTYAVARCVRRLRRSREPVEPGDSL